MQVRTPEAVGDLCCSCREAAGPSPDDTSVSEKRESSAARGDHPRLCGEAMAGAIAAVIVEQVSARGGFSGNRVQ